MLACGMPGETDRKRPAAVDAAQDVPESAEPTNIEPDERKADLEPTTGSAAEDEPPASPPPAPLDPEYEKYLRTALLEQSKAFGTAVLLVSGTALSLSATVVTKGTGTLAAKGVLVAAWVLLVLAMAAEVFALLSSMNLVTAILERRDDSRWRLATVNLNRFIAVTLVGGFFLLLAFAGCNVWR